MRNHRADRRSHGEAPKRSLQSFIDEFHEDQEREKLEKSLALTDNWLNNDLTLGYDADGNSLVPDPESSDRPYTRAEIPQESSQPHETVAPTEHDEEPDWTAHRPRPRTETSNRQEPRSSVATERVPTIPPITRSGHAPRRSRSRCQVPASNGRRPSRPAPGSGSGQHHRDRSEPQMLGGVQAFHSSSMRVETLAPRGNRQDQGRHEALSDAESDYNAPPPPLKQHRIDDSTGSGSDAVGYFDNSATQFDPRFYTLPHRPRTHQAIRPAPRPVQADENPFTPTDAYYSSQTTYPSDPPDYRGVYPGSAEPIASAQPRTLAERLEGQSEYRRPSVDLPSGNSYPVTLQPSDQSMQSEERAQAKRLKARLNETRQKPDGHRSASTAPLTDASHRHRTDASHRHRHHHHHHRHHQSSKTSEEREKEKLKERFDRTKKN